MFSLIPNVLFFIMALFIGTNLGIFIGETIGSNSSTPDPIKNDPRCRIADDLFEQVRDLFSAASIESSTGKSDKARRIRHDAELTLNRANDLVRAIKADHPAPAQIETTPYPVQGYGIESAIKEQEHP